MVRNQRGVIRLVYLLSLFLLGILIWGFLQGRSGNQLHRAVQFDNDLTDVLLGGGIRNGDIIAQSRQERKAGAAMWVEYFREIRLPENVDGATLAGAVADLGRSNGLSVKVTPVKGGMVNVTVGRGERTFSRLLLLPPAKKHRSRAPAGRIAIVIDDVGGSRNLSSYLDLGVPITFAVMPHEAASKAVARDLARRRVPFILHLPLEPEGYPKVDPGRSALFVKMSRSEIEKKFMANLDSVPGVQGVSNHMGSRFSEDPEKMRILLNLVKERGLFYFDSYTTPKTQARKVAQEIGLPFQENSIFLDLKDDRAFMKKQCETLMKMARRNGSAIAIGHIQKKHLPAVLREEIPRFREAGMEFVPLDELVRGGAPAQ